MVLTLSGLFAVVASFVSFYLPVHLKDDLGMSGGEIGVLFALYSATPLLVAVPMGMLADRRAARSLLFIGLGALFVGALSLSTFSAFAAMMPAFILLGFATNSFRQVIDAVWYRRGVSSAAVGRRFGPFLGIRMASVAVGLPLSGMLFGVLGFRVAFAGLALSCLPLAVLVSRVPPVRLEPSPLRRYLGDLLRPSVLFFGLWVFLYTLHWGAEATHYALFLQNDLGLDLPWMGAYMGGEFVSLGLASYFVGRLGWADRDSMAVLIAGMGLTGLTHLLMLDPNPLVSFAYRVAHGAGDGIVITTVYASVGRLFHIDRIGGNAGVVLLISMAGSAVGALVYGPMGEAWGHGVPLAVSGLVCIALIPLLYLGSWWQSRRDA